MPSIGDGASSPAPRGRRPYDPLSETARRAFRYRFRKSLRQRCPSPSAYQIMLIRQMVDTAALGRDALVRAKMAAAAGDTGREMRLLHLYDRHRSALLALDRALARTEKASRAADDIGALASALRRWRNDASA